MKLLTILAAIFLVTICGTEPLLVAQQESKPASKVDSGSKLDQEQEAKEKKRLAAAERAKKRNEYLMSFVRENHPELEQLLLKLKESNPRQYRTAMKGLNQNVISIDAFKEKNPQRYALGVKQWSINSRLKVASAQLRVNDTTENRNAVKALVARQVNFQIERAKMDREVLTRRVATLKKRIADLEKKRAETIENRARALIRKNTK